MFGNSDVQKPISGCYITLGQSSSPAQSVSLSRPDYNNELVVAASLDINSLSRHQLQ